MPIEYMVLNIIQLPLVELEMVTIALSLVYMREYIKWSVPLYDNIIV